MGRSRRSRLALICFAIGATTWLGACAQTPTENARAPLAPRPDRGEVSLALSDFFVRPVGPRGQEPTATLLGLDGKRVLVQGFMVREEEPFPGFFMLTALPVSIAERADGPADSLPPATLFVHLPDAQRSEFVGYVPVRLELAGTLELGMREEAGGRISYVRLRLDDLQDARTADVATPQSP